MRRSYPMIVTATLLLSACISQPVRPVDPGAATDCGSKSKKLHIHYGDSYIEAKPPILKLKKGDGEKQIDVVLHPRPPKGSSKEYSVDNKTVVILGKETNDEWISGSGNKKAGKAEFSICFEAGTEAGDYTYQVIIPGVGILDPRVKVED